MRFNLKRANLFIILLVLVLLAGCSRDTITQGRRSYNVAEVFADNEKALALARAAAQGNVSKINRLIAEGADVNAMGKDEITPLWWALWAGNYKGFVALLEKGGDPNVRRKTKGSIMYYASYSNPKFLEAALKHGGNPNFVEPSTGTAIFFYAIKLGEMEHVDLLLAAGADVNVQENVTKETLPMKAVGVTADYKMVWKLLQAGSDYKLKGYKDHTLKDSIEFRRINPDDDHRYYWREKVMEFLRSKGVDVHRPVGEGERTKPLPKEMP